MEKKSRVFLGPEKAFSGFARLTMTWSSKRMILHFKVQGGSCSPSATYLEFLHSV